MLLPWTSNKNKLPRRGRGGSSWYPPYGDCGMGYSSLSLHHKACGFSTESPVSYEMEYKEPPTLPYDIYCLVVDVLAADDSDPRSRYRFLRSCALTSSAWLSRAHFHLYRKVVLRTRHALLSFVRTITDSPQHFAPLVEHIEVKVSPAHAVHNWPMDHRQVTFPVPAAAIAQMAKLQSARFVGSFQFAETPASLVALVRAFTACGALRRWRFMPSSSPSSGSSSRPCGRSPTWPRSLSSSAAGAPHGAGSRFPMLTRFRPVVIVSINYWWDHSSFCAVSAVPKLTTCDSFLQVSKCSATTPILDVVKTSIQEITLWPRGDLDPCHGEDPFHPPGEPSRFLTLSLSAPNRQPRSPCSPPSRASRSSSARCSARSSSSPTCAPSTSASSR